MTVRNAAKAFAGSCLAQQLDHLYQSITRLRRSKWWKTNVQGGMYRLHVNHHGFWHSHFHLLLESAGISKPELERAWHDVTGATYAVDLQQISDSEADYVRLSRYVLKAPQRQLKHQSQNILDEYSRASKSRRKVQRFAAVAEDEARRISERTKAALTAAKARGTLLGTHRPGHYTGTTEQHRKAAAIARKAAVAAHAAAASLYDEVRPVAAAMKAEGASLQSIADKLNLDGFTTLRGMAWNKMQVSRLLAC